MSIAYLNGEFLPLENAKVSALDRGFLFGDGVYEVIPVFSGRPFRLQQHLLRMQRSLSFVQLPDPLSLEEWASLFRELLAKNLGSAADQSLYVQITRGEDPDGREYRFPSSAKPTVFAMVRAIAVRSPRKAIHAITAEDSRWSHCDIKVINLLPNMLLRNTAYRAGAEEAILFKGDVVTEGAASSLFIVKEGIVITPAKSSHILPGVTRDLLLELLAEHHIPFREQSITVSELRLAEEIWLTSSTWEIAPVVRLDDAAVGQGTVGAMWQRMIVLYDQFKKAFQHAPINEG